MKVFHRIIEHIMLIVLMLLTVIFALKGNVSSIVNWNVWTISAFLMLVITCIYAVLFQIDFKPKKKTTEPDKLSENKIVKPVVNNSRITYYQETKNRIAEETQRVMNEISTEKAYEFEFVMTDENVIDKIIKDMRYKSEEPSGFGTMPYPDLNCVYGVQDKEKTFFLTCYRSISQMIKRCDDYVDDYEFVVLINNINSDNDSVVINKAFTVSCQMEMCSNVPLFMSDVNLGKYYSIIRQAIMFYQSYEKFKVFRNEFEDETGEKFGKYATKVKKKTNERFLKMWGRC